MDAKDKLNDAIRQSAHAQGVKSVRDLQREAQKQGVPLSRKEAKEWLKGEATRQQKDDQKVLDALARAVPNAVKQGFVFGPKDEKALNINGCDGGGNDFRVREPERELPKREDGNRDTGGTQNAERMYVLIGAVFYERYVVVAD